jgi:hypothetical protein
LSAAFQHHHIIGIGRSGTTLLQSLLNAHPDIWAGPEDYFIPFFYRQWKNKTTFTAKDLKYMESFHNAFAKLQPYVGFTFDTAAFLQSKPENFNGMVKNTYDSFVDELNPEKKATLYVNKNPLHSLYLNELEELNPESKFIWMMRDYRANVFSRIQSVHLKRSNVYFNSVRWVYFYKKMNRFQNKNPKKVMVLRYEDLVEAPEKHSKKVLTFLNADIQKDLPSLLLPYQKKYKTEVASNYQGIERMEKRFGDLAQPIHTDTIDKWKNGLSEHQILIAEVICGKFGSEQGYQASTRCNRFQWVSIQIIAFFVKLFVISLLKKDALFNSLPLPFKVTYFLRWVEKIDKKRKKNMDFKTT